MIKPSDQLLSRLPLRAGLALAHGLNPASTNARGG